jgi:hypothetical protein
MNIEELKNIDAVVIGAGPAGLSCIKELVKLKKRTLLIFPNDHLGSDVGGMANNWHSQCALFDEYEFQNPEIFKLWPISYNEYMEYVKEVEEILEVEMKANNYEEELLEVSKNGKIKVHSINSVIGTKKSWNTIFETDLQSPNVRIIDGTVTRILKDVDATGVVLRNQKILTFDSRVKIYLAAGCVENTKILQSSNIIESDVLGKYLADHPVFENHLLLNGSKEHFYPLFQRKKFISRNHLVKQKYRVLKGRNVIGIFEIRHFFTSRAVDDKLKSISVFEILKQLANLLSSKISKRIIFRPLKTKLWIQLAQEVNQESIINFDSVDPVIDWKLNTQDLINYENIVLAAETLLSSWGFEVVPIKKIESTDDLQENMIPAYHPSGTTRMHENIEFGVTDMNGKVHGLSNLYICGSSTFTTPGWANPTLSIMALSIRTVRISAQNSN